MANTVGAVVVFVMRIGAAGSGANLDLVNFERHQAGLVFGVNF